MAFLQSANIIEVFNIPYLRHGMFNI